MREGGDGDTGKSAASCVFFPASPIKTHPLTERKLFLQIFQISVIKPVSAGIDAVGAHKV